MNRYVIDTQTLIRFLVRSKGVNKKATAILEKADRGESIIIIPAVVIFEIGYLYEKKRIPVSIHDIKRIIEKAVNYQEEKLSVEIIKAAFEIIDIPELHDRLIAGTARYLDAPIITNDPVILKSKYVRCVKSD